MCTRALYIDLDFGNNAVEITTYGDTDMHNWVMHPTNLEELIFPNLSWRKIGRWIPDNILQFEIQMIDLFD